MLNISGTVHHVIITLLHKYKIMISGDFFFFLILIFWAVNGVKGQKIAQNEK